MIERSAELPGRPQSWTDCDPDIRGFLDQSVDLLQSDLGDQLVGVYLHGSLAMGSYFRPKSDFDVLVVVRSELSSDIAAKTNLDLAHHAENRPTIGDLELSAITADTAKCLPFPMPYEFHNSSSWHDRILKGDVDYSSPRTDLDLSAHVPYVIERGICLFGTPAEEVFGPIDWDAFNTAVRDDFDWIVADDNLLETPVYGVLNICRILRSRREPTRLFSKDEGAVWALTNVPAEHRDLVQRAVDAYRSSQPVTEALRRTAGLTWDADALRSFRDYATRSAQGSASE